MAGVLAGVAAGKRSTQVVVAAAGGRDDALAWRNLAPGLGGEG